MNIDFQDEKPIYIQLAELIEDAVLSGAFKEETQIPSTTEISASYKINPATALKGINILVENGTIYKRRGVGMFVSLSAVGKILLRRQQGFFDLFILNLVDEANKLKISKEDVIKLIERGFSE